MTTTTVLAQVLKQYGDQCLCRGACGKAHGLACYKADVKLAAAHEFPSASDTENARVPVEGLRPWCRTCLNAAVKRARENDAELRRIQGDERQLGFEIPGMP